MLGPKALPCRPGQLRLAADEVDLAVVEERVLVQVRRADRQPAVVNDPDLRVDVDRLPDGAVSGVERAGEKRPAPASASAEYAHAGRGCRRCRCRHARR